MVPKFMHFEVPRINFDFEFYNDGRPQAAERIFNFNVNSFLISSALVDTGKEILVPVSLTIHRADLPTIRRLLELGMEGKTDKMGIRIKYGGEFLKELKVGSLMYWLKDLILDIPIGELYAKMKAKSAVEEQQAKLARPERTEPEANTSTTASAPAPPNTNTKENVEKNQIASVRFLKVEKVPNGGNFVFQFRILRSFASNFIGKLPELNFELNYEDAKLLGIKFLSNNVEAGTKYLELNFEVSVSNLRKLVYIMMRASNRGTAKLHEMIPEIKKITKLEFKSIVSEDKNMLSSLLSVFDADILFDDNGSVTVVSKSTSTQLYPRPVDPRSISAQKASEPQLNEKNKDKEKKNLELSTKFAINNAENAANKKFVDIEASINLKEKPYGGDFARISWETFVLSVKNKQNLLLTFKIHQGLVNVGVSGGITPFSASFSTGITIPSDDKNLEALGKVLSTFTKGKEDLLTLDFEIEYQNEETKAHQSTESIKLDAVIPCKSLLLPENSEAKPKDEPKESDADDKQLPKESEAKQPERTDFLGKVKNSILSFVSFQASTFFFHATYPNGHYCKQQVPEDEFDMKMNIEIALPMIEANVCSSENGGTMTPLHCFASGGISRPMEFSIEMIDSQICHVESTVLPQEVGAYLSGLDTIKEATKIDYNDNEIPIHVAVKDVAALAAFCMKFNAKKPQFLTVGPVDKASSINNFIGVVVSSIFAIELPEPQKAKKLTETAEKETKDSAEIEPVLVQFNPANPAILDLKSSSPSNKELILDVGFRLPKKAFEGITIAGESDNSFDWPAVQWGSFKYTVGINGAFEASISMKRGQIDMKKEGIIPSALMDFGFRFTLATQNNYVLGSTALRQLFGTLKKYFTFTDQNEKNDLYHKLFVSETDKILYYKFAMNSPRGLIDRSVFLAEGEVPLKNLVTVGDALIKNVLLESKKEEADSSEVKNEPPVNAETVERNLFSGSKVTMKTVSSKYGLPHLKFPCLIPTLCKGTAPKEEQRVSQDHPTELAFELKNILKPVTQLIGRKLGPVLQKFKLANYPSHLRFKYSSISAFWVTFMLNGAGLVSVGLNPFEIDRNAMMTYDERFKFIELVPDATIKTVDKFEIGLQLYFPDTLLGLRSTLSMLRKESQMMPPIAPIYFTSKPDGSFEKKELSNAPFYIALGSDDRQNPQRNNLISALMAACLQEIVAPAINMSDESLKRIHEPQVERESTSETEMSVISTTDMLKIGGCLLTGSSCDSTYDYNYNVRMPFENEILRFIFPATSIIRLYIEKALIMQIVTDARRQNVLEIASKKGLSFLGNANICFNGLYSKEKQLSRSIKSYIREGKDLAPSKLQIILGQDIDINVNIELPLYAFGEYLNSKFPSISKLFRSTDKGPFNRLISEKAELNDLVRQARRERTNCLYRSDQTEHDPTDYSYSVIFYEKGKEVISTGMKVPLYLQLRNGNDEILCGRPKNVDNFQIEFIRTESQQGFIKLVDLFSYKCPATDEYKVTATAKYDARFNLFVIDEVTFLHTGRYQIKLIFGTSVSILDETIIYVKNDF